MNIILLTENDKVAETTYIISDNRANHIIKILKPEVGDILEIGLLNNCTGKAKVKKINASSVELEIVKLNEPQNNKIQIEIILSLPRPQTLKKVLNTIASMNVAKLYLIRSGKVEKSYFHSPLLQEKKYSKYLLEGLSQGKKVLLPEVEIYKKFKPFFEDTFSANLGNTALLLAHPESDKFLTGKNIKGKNRIILAIGPEGGWNDFEVDFMTAKGFEKIKLSENILRVETAVTAALAQIELINFQL